MVKHCFQEEGLVFPWKLRRQILKRSPTVDSRNALGIEEIFGVSPVRTKFENQENIRGPQQREYKNRQPCFLKSNELFPMALNSGYNRLGQVSGGRLPS
jgi:hypothetical protein